MQQFSKQQQLHALQLYDPLWGFPLGPLPEFQDKDLLFRMKTH